MKHDIDHVKKKWKQFKFHVWYHEKQYISTTLIILVFVACATALSIR